MNYTTNTSNSTRLQNGAVFAMLSLCVLMACNAANNNSSVNIAVRSVQVQLGNQDSNVIKTSWPSIGCWFWSKDEFEGEGYKTFIDLHEKHAPFKLLTTSLRYPGDLTDPAVHERIKAASLYAKDKGMALVMDLDIRLARDSFKAKYPGELQQLVILKEFELKGSNGSVGVKGNALNDHYTYGRTPYDVTEVKLLNVYSYQKKDGLIQSGTVKDISQLASATETKDSVYVTVTRPEGGAAVTACALVAVTLNTPDVFAPHLLSFQRDILKQYADASLAGACKDEWGFPGRFTTPTNELWYSPAMAGVYEKQRPGRNLLKDLLLMSFGETGALAERTAAINHYMEMNHIRNGEIETDYYHAIKEVFGKQAMSATHATWFPYPDNREIFKNGLSWWASKRDLAQTDEATPFSARTALSKKMHSPLWFNMYYDKTIQPYYKDIWSAALAGGRLNYHPLWPVEMAQLNASLLKDSVMLAETRVSLLNYISEAAPDCPVAVIFGHAAATNFSNKKVFADVGLNVANALWKKGYYADLIPSSEITNGSVTINKNGKVQYGAQQYEAVVYYHPEYDKQPLATFFNNAAAAGKTTVFRVGDWSTNFEGQSFDGVSALGAAVKKADEVSIVSSIVTDLQSKNITVQTEGEEHTVSGFPASVMPKPSGQLRLIDGTIIWVAGEQNALGDPIQKSTELNGKTVKVDAVGVAAVRFNKNGELEALAAGGLKSIQAGAFNLQLPERADIALFKQNGKWKGIIHGAKAHLNVSLQAITTDWTEVKLPELYKPQ